MNTLKISKKIMCIMILLTIIIPFIHISYATPTNGSAPLPDTDSNSSASSSSYNSSAPLQDDANSSVSTDSSQQPTNSNATSDSNGELQLYSKSSILIDSTTGQILYEHNAYEKLYPASTTKLMTAILTLENCQLTDTVTVNPDALKVFPPHIQLQLYNLMNN